MFYAIYDIIPSMATNFPFINTYIHRICSASFLQAYTLSYLLLISFSNAEKKNRNGTEKLHQILKLTLNVLQCLISSELCLTPSSIDRVAPLYSNNNNIRRQQQRNRFRV